MEVDNDDTKLNLNQPLLSARRCGPTLNLLPESSATKKPHNPRPVLPRLSPSRPELKSGPITNPGSVPFLWERTPGHPKPSLEPPVQMVTPIEPKLPPGRLPEANFQHASNGESSDSEDYVDALESLSRTESFSLNCSMSELSGLDVISFGNFLKDPQNRTFMMDRFIPAAKAIASAAEASHLAPKKQPVMEQKQPIIGNQYKPSIIGNQYKPSIQYGPSFSMQYSHCDEEESDEDEDDHHHNRGNLSAACGLLSQFCLKTAIGVAPMSSFRKVRSSSNNKVDNEVKPIGKVQKKLRNEMGRVGRGTSTYYDAPSSIDEKKGVGTVHDEIAVKDFRLHGKGSKTFHELLAEKDNSEDLGSGGSVVEKIVYVDTVQTVKSSTSGPNSTDEENEYKAEDALCSTESHGKDRKCETDSSSFAECEETKDFSLVPTPAKNIERGEEAKGLEKQPLPKSDQNCSKLPGKPPLPKSPTDSWLYRTLPPQKSRKNPTLRSYLSVTNNHENLKANGTGGGASHDTKWESFVKATKVKQRPMHPSEGLMTAMPET